MLPFILDAEAFTRSDEIFFGAGESAAAEHLLAHEQAHADFWIRSTALTALEPPNPDAERPFL